MNKTTYLLLLFAIAFTPISQAQYGPGGVGDISNLHLWLKTDGLDFKEGDSIQNWKDFSQNNNPAFQNLDDNRPTFQSSVPELNGLPGIFFSGGTNNLTSSFLKVADDLAFDDNINQMDLYAFVRPTNIGSPSIQGIISKRIDFNTSGDYAFTLFLNNQVLTADINAYQSGRLSAGANPLSNNKFFLNSSFDGARSPNDQRHQLYSNSISLNNRDPGSVEITRSESDITIGVLNEGYSQYFAGYIPELIFFNTKLNQTQRNIVDNYIATKFDINITPNKIYDLGDSTNGNFDFNVIGIGQESFTDNHTNSKGSGIIRINTPSDLGDGEYLFIGSDIIDDSQLNLDDIDCSTSTADDIESKAIWRVGEYRKTVGTADVGTITISFDTAAMGLPLNDAELLVSGSTDFSSSTPISSLSFGGEVIFTGVDFDNGDYIKIRFKNVQPVTWDGINWANGSGGSNEPTIDDQFKKMIIDGAGATLNLDAGCSCLQTTTGSNLNLNGFSLRVQKDIINYGNITGNGSLNFLEPNSHNIQGNGFGLANLTTNSDLSLNLYLDELLDVSDILSIDGGILATNNQLYLSCDFVSGKTAQVGPVATGSSINGNVTVEQCYPARRAFRLLTSSVTTTTTIHDNWQEGATAYNDNLVPDNYGTHITGLALVPGSGHTVAPSGGDQFQGLDWQPSGNPSMYTFDNIGRSWDPVLDTEVVLSAGVPYRLMIRGDRKIDIRTNSETPTKTRLRAKGELVTGQNTQTNFSTDAGSFNFIANPYHAQVDMDQLTANSSNIKNTFYYVWDPTLGGMPTAGSSGGRGAYVTVDIQNNTNTFTPISPNKFSSTDKYLQPMQAAFVLVDAPGAAEVKFEESFKNVSATQTETKSQSDKQYINIQLFDSESFSLGETASDGLRIDFDKSNSSTSEDDAPKLGNLDENLARIEGSNYSAIEKRPYPEAEEKLELFVNHYRREAYVMKFNLTNNLNTKVFIEDKYLNQTQEITSSDDIYAFTVDESISESVASDRFKIVLNPVSLSTVEETLVDASLYPNPTKGSFRISGANLGEGAKIEIYNMIGQQVYKTNLENKPTTEITNFNGSAGVYLVKLKTNKGEKTFKLIKQ